jgi:hypothetical protein
VSAQLLCDDEILRAELSAALGDVPRPVAVNVLPVPVSPGVPLVEEDVARLRALTEERLMRVTRLMRAQVASMGARRGLVVNVLGRAATPDALALAVDDGIVALTQVMKKKHPHLDFLCIQHGVVPLPAGTLCTVITQRALAPGIPWGGAPLVLDAGVDRF